MEVEIVKQITIQINQTFIEVVKMGGGKYAVFLPDQPVCLSIDDNALWQMDGRHCDQADKIGRAIENYYK